MACHLTRFSLLHAGVTSQINPLQVSPCLKLCFQREHRQWQFIWSHGGTCLILRSVSNQFKIRTSSCNWLNKSIEHLEKLHLVCCSCGLFLWLLPNDQGHEPREYRWSLIYEPASNQNRQIAPVFLAPGMDVSSFWVRILSDLKVTCFLFKLRHS